MICEFDLIPDTAWIGLNLSRKNTPIGLDWVRKNGPLSNSVTTSLNVPRSRTWSHWSSRYPILYCSRSSLRCHVNASRDHPPQSIGGSPPSCAVPCVMAPDHDQRPSLLRRQLRRYCVIFVVETFRPVSEIANRLYDHEILNLNLPLRAV